jgi:multimeric flavodoxin WrbA
MKNIIVCPEKPSNMLSKMISSASKNYSFDLFCENFDDIDFRNKRILFAVELGKSGINLELMKIFKLLEEKGPYSMENSIGSVIIHSDTDLNTRSVGREIIFRSNQLGCAFPGRPIVEAIKTLKNFVNYKKYFDMNLEEACLKNCSDLSDRLLNYKLIKKERPKVLVVHSSNVNTSNTYMLWRLVRKNLKDCEINEVYLGEDNIADCRGCLFAVCNYFGEQISCFYEDAVVKKIYPAILEADYMIFLCPNYNDSLMSNLTATINRLTALYRTTNFYDKNLYSIIVSGNTGSDIISKQLISSLNINKTFSLPPYFSLMETANYPKDVLKITNIKEKAKEFADNILR